MSKNNMLNWMQNNFLKLNHQMRNHNILKSCLYLKVSIGLLTTNNGVNYQVNQH
jgi:hypothetical protein